MGFQPKLDEQKIIEMWEDLVGKLIARDTDKLFVRDGKLFVRFKSAALKQEVSYAKSKLLLHVNDAIGGKRIKDIVIM